MALEPPTTESAYYFEMHEKGQSVSNYELDVVRKSIDLLAPKMYNMYLSETETILINRGEYECDENNEMQLSFCIQEFIEDKLQCKLPWSQTGQVHSICTTESQFKLFENVSSAISSEKGKNHETLRTH